MEKCSHCGLEMRFKVVKGRGRPVSVTYKCPQHRIPHTAHKENDGWVCQHCIDSAEPVPSPITHLPPQPRSPTPPLPIPPHPRAFYNQGSAFDELTTFSSRCEDVFAEDAFAEDAFAEDVFAEDAFAEEGCEQS